MRLLRWSAIAAIILIAAAWAAAWVSPGLFATLTGRLESPGAVSVGGPFQLTDHTGKQVTEQSFRGRFMLVYFGYTYCPDVCPTELQTMANALDLLGPDAARIAPLFITVDPERDTVTALGEYVTLFDKRLIGLTGTVEQTTAVARAYRVYYAKVSPKDSTTYLMDHSSFLYLMGPDGSFRSLFRQGMSPDDLAKALRTRLAG
jgi:protein SCO1/2